MSLDFALGFSLGFLGCFLGLTLGYRLGGVKHEATEKKSPKKEALFGGSKASVTRRDDLSLYIEEKEKEEKSI